MFQLPNAANILKYFSIHIWPVKSDRSWKCFRAPVVATATSTVSCSSKTHSDL